MLKFKNSNFSVLFLHTGLLWVISATGLLVGLVAFVLLCAAGVYATCAAGNRWGPGQLQLPSRRSPYDENRRRDEEAARRRLMVGVPLPEFRVR
jgi:hypothetical protein